MNKESILFIKNITLSSTKKVRQLVLHLLEDFGKIIIEISLENAFNSKM